MVIPRMLGYAFNPIAFFFCYDEHGQLGAVLHQVKNNFGDQTSYLLPVTGPGVARGQAARHRHVPPFSDRDGGDRFALSAPDFDSPGATLALSTRHGAEGAPPPLPADDPGEFA